MTTRNSFEHTKSVKDPKGIFSFTEIRVKKSLPSVRSTANLTGHRSQKSSGKSS